MTAASIPEARKLFSGNAQQRLLAFASLIVLLVGFSLASDRFMQLTNMMSILQATSVNGVLAVAATLVIITGGIDLSICRSTWVSLSGPSKVTSTLNSAAALSAPAFTACQNWCWKPLEIIGI